MAATEYEYIALALGGGYRATNAPKSPQELTESKGFFYFGCKTHAKQDSAKDTSRKVKTALHAKFAEEQRTFAYAPLGYIRHPEIKNTLAVDNETKWIIEKIFDLAVHGAGAAKITKILTTEKVPTAGYLNFIRYGTFAHIYEGRPEEKSYACTYA